MEGRGDAAKGKEALNVVILKYMPNFILQPFYLAFRGFPAGSQMSKAMEINSIPFS
jgi:hypothetical protein